MSVQSKRRLFTRTYALVCDGCGRETGGFPALAAAIDWAAGSGWRSARTGGRYRDACPACAGERGSCPAGGPLPPDPEQCRFCRRNARPDGRPCTERGTV